MISLGGAIFVATAPVDFRGSFERLSGLVREQLADDPRSGAFFVFVNRRGDRLKILYFDGSGDCIPPCVSVVVASSRNRASSNGAPLWGRARHAR